VLLKEEKDITYPHRRRAQTIGVPDVVTGIQTEHKSVLSFNYISFLAELKTKKSYKIQKKKKKKGRESVNILRGK
jgi:hypothetical protein